LVLTVSIVTAEEFYQSAKLREDGNVAVKRTKKPRPEHRRSRSAVEHRRIKKAEVDFTGCEEDLEEARRRVDAQWEPDCDILGLTKASMQKGLARTKTLPTPDATPERDVYDGTRRRSEPTLSSSVTSDDLMDPDVQYQNEYSSPNGQSGRSPDTPESMDDARVSWKGAPGRKVQIREGTVDDLMKDLFLGTDSVLPESNRMTEQRARLAKEREIRRREEAAKARREFRLHRRHPLRVLVQPLVSKWDNMVQDVYETRDQSRVLTTSMEGTELRQKDFRTLLGHHAWLNDEIINTYIEWVVKAANEAATVESISAGESVSTVPKFIAHNSFFYENLKKKGPNSTERLMKRKKAPGTSLLEVDSIFVPICSGSHWTIGVVRPVAKTIEYFDSMGGRKPEFFGHMRQWLQFQLKNRYKAEEWTEPKTACAWQSNGYDCGVFVCTNAFCVAVGLDTSCYVESHMEEQRRNIAAVLINRGFTGDFSWSKSGLLPQ
jgi:sentrin-specific protease 1